MIFVVHRLREIERNVEVPLFMCFIDLQKAPDTVDHTLPWQVLTPIGVPPDIIAVVQQFHSRMRACMRHGDGVCSDWFKVEQCLWQGYVLPPLLFIILFVVVLTVVLVNIQLGYGPPRRAGTPEGTADVDGTVTGHGLLMSSDGVCCTRTTPS